MNELDLIKPFEETIYKEGIEEVTIDFAEMTLDELTKLVFKDVSDTILDFPIINWAAALGKTGWSISKAASLRKQLVFIQNLRSGTIDLKAIEKRRIAINKHEKWIEKEIETSVIFLERYTNVRKAIYQARMYRDLLNGIITFEEYEEYISILDQMIIGDLGYLLDVITYIVENEDDLNNPEKLNEVSKRFHKIRCGRLESLGLLRGIITSRVGSSTVDRYIPTEQGYYLYTVIRDENDTTHPKIIIKEPVIPSR